jgi:hypothetical protein
MSLLAHATCGARGLEPDRKALDKRIQHEITEAKRIQRETGCSWSEALRIAGKWERS